MSLEIIQRPSPNCDDRQGVEPTLLILHYTGMKSAEEAIARLTNPESKVSSHYTIDEEGKIYAHVEEEKRAWHAGAGRWRHYQNINMHSIGIEIVNPGHEHGYKEFPKVQIEAVKKLCRDIMSRREIEPEDVLAHSDTAPDRKEDPGELFPWEALAKEGIGIWPSVSVEDKVKAYGIEIHQALKDFGYRAEDPQKAIIAFQRHFVPEVFEERRAGEVTSLTKARLYALLAEHLISSN